MISSVLLGLLGAAGVVSARNGTNRTNLYEGRPLAHLTPPEGWMNDPNGLWYDAKEDLYHAYFQYNPNGTVWDLPLYWGHSVSSDLTNWLYQGIAIEPERDDSGAYSGSAVIDTNNTSGLFNDSVDPRQRVVAIWTYNTPDKESQYLSYSVDGGYSFIPYENNPVLDINSTQFRDPKVIWHEESKKWIMTVAHSQKYEILIYSSPNLKDWKLESSFGDQGYLGYQYECPGLARVPLVQSGNGLTLSNLTYPNTTFYNSSYFNSTSNGKAKEAWVLFISINPGAPQGGSATQYFIGDFNGTHFVPFTHQTRFIDMGKDYYALQTFFNSKHEGDVLSIAWASNWQYGSLVPTEKWRSSMSLVRNLTLKEWAPNPESVQLNLNSEPILDMKPLNAKNASTEVTDFLLTTNNSLSANFAPRINTGIYDFEIVWSVNENAFNNSRLNEWILYIDSQDYYSEYLALGYDTTAGAFYLDRGNSYNDFVTLNPFFNNRQSVFLEPYSTSSNGTNTYKVYGVIDQNIIELYFNDGSVVSTNLFFFSDQNQIRGFETWTNVNGGFKFDSFKFHVLDF
ncbi:hypothetical protein HG536_0H04850 [Torulaspora globosa]|uniref:Glycosyl hydrolase family 32 N-terminal domain-containing protein n=1 Tax=Torulaspora globosa TaxID=48254 RepID=A0A7G3ZNM3_9SACH|nr:uncharacterized protein HG536_0H04850 [Torulaspora globosa]QLL35109.1 hypothetical protein HG536_0H04850 [Torulaspora globosa]